MLLRLGEAGAVKLLVCSRVLEELEGALRRKAPAVLGMLAVLLDRSGLEVVSAPGPDTLQYALALTGHQGDAGVLAAALDCGTDYLVTLDRKHFLDNQPLKEAVPFPVGTPGDFLAWYREKITL